MGEPQTQYGPLNWIPVDSIGYLHTFRRLEHAPESTAGATCFMGADMGTRLNGGSGFQQTTDFTVIYTNMVAEERSVHATENAGICCLRKCRFSAGNGCNQVARFYGRSLSAGRDFIRRACAGVWGVGEFNYTPIPPRDPYFRVRKLRESRHV
jgi:hypothetical protein